MQLGGSSAERTAYIVFRDDDLWCIKADARVMNASRGNGQTVKIW